MSESRLNGNGVEWNTTEPTMAQIRQSVTSSSFQPPSLPLHILAESQSWYMRISSMRNPTGPGLQATRDSQDFNVEDVEVRQEPPSKSGPKRQQQKSVRYKWNVSLFLLGNKLSSYIAFVSSHNINLFRRHYRLESAAALAADIAKAISQGPSCRERLNFPGKSTDEFPLDVNLAALRIHEELISQRGTAGDTLGKAKDVVVKILRDVAESICEYTSNQVVPQSISTDMLGRMVTAQAFIDDALSNLEKNHPSIKARSIHQALPPDRLPSALINQIMPRTGQKQSTSQNRSSQRKGTAPSTTGAKEDDTWFTTSKKPTSMKGSRSASQSTKQKPPSTSNLTRTAGQSRKQEGKLLMQKLKQEDRTKRGSQDHMSLNTIRKKPGTRSILPVKRINAPHAEAINSVAQSSLERRPSSAPAQQPIACSHDTLCFIYLRQEALYRIMNLENIILSYGWDLQLAGLTILNGAMVVVSRADGWKMRCISSWCPETMNVTLEDGTCVSPFELANDVLEPGKTPVEYLIQEYNYKIHKKEVEPFTANRVLQVFYRLLCCARAVRKLPATRDAAKLIKNLVQTLIIGPPASFLEEFTQFLEPQNSSHVDNVAQQHMSMMKKIGGRLPGFFREWLGCEEDIGSNEEINVENDLKMYLKRLRSMHSCSSPLQDLHSEHSTQEDVPNQGLHNREDAELGQSGACRLSPTGENTTLPEMDLQRTQPGECLTMDGMKDARCRRDADSSRMKDSSQVDLMVARPKLKNREPLSSTFTKARKLKEEDSVGASKERCSPAQQSSA